MTFSPYLALVGDRDHRALVTRGAQSAVAGPAVTALLVPGLGAYALPFGTVASAVMVTATLLRRARQALTKP